MRAGIRIIDSVKEHPFKPKLPEIRDTGNTVIVILFSPKTELLEKTEPIMSRYEPIMSQLNERQKAALEYLSVSKEIGMKMYVEIAECSKATAKRDLHDLVLKGVIKQKGTGRATYYVLRDVS
ncbi:hypothetical protein HYW21_00485 [Candidatus Woesearchaeota archaeon]|nr:hypothetical protein [Candidatus Woesearchaeota archaeon]